MPVKKKNPITIDPKINVGQLITILTLVVMTSIAWGTMKAELANKADASEVSELSHSSEIRDLNIEKNMALTTQLLQNLVTRVEQLEQAD